MIRPSRRWTSRLAALPLGLLLGATAVPLVYVLAHVSGDLSLESSSFGQTLVFAVGGAAIATAAGGAIGMLIGMRRFPGRSGLLALSIMPIAAPPAYWWIGATRLMTALGSASGPVPAAIVAGLALAPVTLLLVYAAMRQIPSNLYESARVALPPTMRVFVVLLPLLCSALLGGFILTVILLLGESELPFLFGFRTVMTDIVTTFAQTFDVGRTVPVVVPLLMAILVMGALAAPPLMRTVLASSRGAHGVVPRRGSALLSLWAMAPAAGVVFAMFGYAWSLAGSPNGWPRVTIDLTTVGVSILEPVGCAWISLIVTIAAVYAVRRSRAMPALLCIGLTLFCVPAAIYAIGWLGLGQVVGGFAVPPSVAHTSRGVALATLGFAVGYSRLPQSLEAAAALVHVSPMKRAFIFVLPLVKWPLAATAALIAAVTYADRDVASLLLPPGASRLTLNLYLASANAPSSITGALALIAILGAAVTVATAAMGPALLWRRRG